jgi:hypothetical protein
MALERPSRDERHSNRGDFILDVEDTLLLIDRNGPAVLGDARAHPSDEAKAVRKLSTRAGHAS